MQPENVVVELCRSRQGEFLCFCSFDGRCQEIKSNDLETGFRIYGLGKVICRIATLKYDFILKHELDIKGGSEGFSISIYLNEVNFKWQFQIINERRRDDKRFLKMGVMNFDDGGEAGRASCMMWWCQHLHQLRNPVWQILCKANNNNNNRILI